VTGLVHCAEATLDSREYQVASGVKIPSRQEDWALIQAWVFPHQHGATVAPASQDSTQVSKQAATREPEDSARAGLKL
jgi:hypothetical protein